VKQSFDGLKLEMDEACEALRSFTLGRDGFTRRNGVDGISRINVLCGRMQKDYGSGSHEKETGTAVASAQGKILAARARLNLLSK
jgi:hypothetical protein